MSSITAAPAPTEPVCPNPVLPLDPEAIGAAPLLPVVGGDLLAPLSGGREGRYINLDYAASAPALEAVWQRVVDFAPYSASVHRGAGFASQVSTTAYENARVVLGRFVNAREDDTLVITRNTTDSLALLASAVPGETIVLDLEHHANLLPWIHEEAGNADPASRPAVRIVRSGATVAETLDLLAAELRRRPAALVSVTGASNVTGETLPLRRIATLAHRNGARLAVDGAQLVPHRRVDVQALGIDYLAFSGHKTYAPFGAGVLVGRSDWLDAAPPYLRGGGAVRSVALDDADDGSISPAIEWHRGAARHEAGSPDVVGAVALARAAEVLSALDPDRWVAHERALHTALVAGLSGIDGVRVLRILEDAPDVLGVVSFTVDGVGARALAVELADVHGIGVRDGRFCAHPLLARLGVGPAVRASVGVGSRLADVEALVAAVGAIARRERGAGGASVVDGSVDPASPASPVSPGVGEAADRSGTAERRPSWAIPLPGAGTAFGCSGE